MANLPLPDDFDKGREAYLNGDGHLYLTGTADLKAGYREAFDENNIQKNDNSGFWAEVAWDQHYADEIEGVNAADQKLSQPFCVPAGGSR